MIIKKCRILYTGIDVKENNHLQTIVLQAVKSTISAQNRTRTCTAVRPLVPETSVSTNFTIWAKTMEKIKDKSTKIKINSFWLFPFYFCLFSAQNRTRTCTSLLTLVPETSASTNFAIWAD